MKLNEKNMNKSRGQHEIYSFKIILDGCGKMDYFRIDKTVPFLFFRVSHTFCDYK